MKLGTPPQSTIKKSRFALKGRENHDVGLSLFEEMSRSIQHVAKQTHHRTNIWNDSNTEMRQLDVGLLLHCKS